jgi:hypothetical protein
MDNLKDNILNKIKSGEVDMKPHWHFALKSLLLILGIVVSVLLAVYILSFIHFYLRQSGIWFVPFYGFRGLSIFVMNSPWLLIASAGALLVVIQLLVRKYAFSFHQPLLYSLLGIIILVLLGVYATLQTQIHPRLHGLAQDRGISVFGPLYRGIEERRPESITFGTITEVHDNGFTLESVKGEIVTVVLTSRTKRPPNRTFTVEQFVIVFGDREEDSVTAIGVRPTPPDFEFNRRGNLGPRGSLRPNVPPLRW